MPITAVVLAGGRGTRIAELYPDIPKPMVPVCGRPFLHWVTGWLAGQGIGDIVYSVGYRAEQIERWMEGARGNWDISPNASARTNRWAPAVAFCNAWLCVPNMCWW